MKAFFFFSWYITVCFLTSDGDAVFLGGVCEEERNRQTADLAFSLGNSGLLILSRPPCRHCAVVVVCWAAMGRTHDGRTRLYAQPPSALRGSLISSTPACIPRCMAFRVRLLYSCSQSYCDCSLHPATAARRDADSLHVGLA